MTSRYPVGPVLTPLDGTPHALVAVPVARELATVLGAEAHALYVGGPPVPPHELPRHVALGADQLAGFVLSQLIGDPAARLLEVAAARRAAAIVTSSHTGMSRPRGAFGPLVARIAPIAPCPIVLVRYDRGLIPWRLQEILLPYDGTPSTAAALAPAADLARRSGAKLYVLYVAEPHAAGPEERGSITPPRYVDQPQHEWPAWAGEFLERLTCMSGLDLGSLRLLVARGSPGFEIVRLAREHGIDLIVVAWKGRMEPNRAPTAKEILLHSPAPILVLRTPSFQDEPPCPPD